MALTALAFLSTVRDVGPLPRDIFAEPECQLTTRRSPPDLVWTAAQDWPARAILSTPINDIRARMVGQRVRVAGVIHLEFEFYGLFPTWTAADHHPENAVQVGVGT